MIKQPFLPLKWYNELEEQQFRKLRRTTKDFYVLRTDTIINIPFQIKRVNRGAAVIQWDLVNYDDGTVTNLNTGYLEIKIATDGDGTIWNFIIKKARPIWPAMPEGFHYFIVSDGYETWYSEVFEVCDLLTNPIAAFYNDATYPFDTLTTAKTSKRILLKLCENTGNVAIAYSNQIYNIIYNEPVDVYVVATLGTLGCAYGSFGDNLDCSLYEFGTRNKISETVEIEEGVNCFQLTPTKTCDASLVFELANGEFCWQDLRVWVFFSKLDSHIIMRYNNSKNFCDIIYNDENNDDYCDYEEYIYFHEAITMEPSYEVEEESAEYPNKELVPLIQAARKYYKMKFPGGHHMSDAMSIVRLHDDIKFYLPTGEILDICDFIMENSYFNDACETIELTFRELPCVRTACEDLVVDDCCCPTQEDVLDYVAGGVGALPACGPGTDGDRYLVLVAGFILLYECDNGGAGWTHMTGEEEDGNCIYDLDGDASDTYNQYYYWDGSDWRLIAELTLVTDNTDGTATLNVNGCQCLYPDDAYYFPCPITIQAEYKNGGVWQEIGDPVDSYDAITDGITVETGVGNFDFRIRYYTHNCDFSYHGDINQTITDV